MSKSKQKKDTGHPGQQSFDFENHIQEYENLRIKLMTPDKPKPIESYEEACMEVATGAKEDIRNWGGSREQLVDAINEYFGTPGRLSIHMFNHHLSKPVEYPMPCVLIYAIQHITGSLRVISNLARAQGAQVINGEEKRKLAIGELDDAIAKMHRLRKELRDIKK